MQPGSEGGPEIRVDPATLTELAGELRGENDATLRPQSDRVAGTFSTGVPFGAASASGYVFAAKERYQQSLIQAIDTLDQYVRAADIFATAAERAAQNYKQSDGRSDELTRSLNEALAAARAAQLSPTSSGSRRAV